jgi:hypothetical protein
LVNPESYRGVPEKEEINGRRWCFNTTNALTNKARMSRHVS